VSEPFLGEIKLLPFNFAPRGYAFCAGQILPIAQNTALFSLLGTTFGGNGQTTFALPDLRGRVPVSSGQGPGLSNYDLGEVTGTETVTLTSNQMPAHNHLVNANNAAADATRPGNNYPGTSAYSTTNGGNTMNPAVIAQAGGSQPFSNVQPLLVLNFCIALEGIFPSRN
jgi:microcystin-dependent protein